MEHDSAVPFEDDDDPTPVPFYYGLDRQAMRLYVLAVRHPSLTRLHMVAAGIPDDAITPAIDLLTRHGILRSTGEDRWEAIPPDLALPTLAMHYEARAAHLRDSAEDLAHVYHANRIPSSDEIPHGVTLLRNHDELNAAIQTVTGTAISELCAAYADSPATAHLLDNSLHWHREKLKTRTGKPLQRRATFDSAVFRHDRAADVLRTRAESGEDNRTLTGIPFSVIVADGSEAVIDLTAFDTSGAGSLLVRDRRFVLALRGLCETWWRLGTPMAWAGNEDLDRVSALIMSMLAAGSTDAMMAARAGLSQRTIERRVRTLMNRLGATTRFQAGVLAARRGWL